MITLLRNGEIFAPQSLGKKDILIVGRSIAAIVPPGQVKIEGVQAHEVDATGKIIVPGFVDSHVHILGGGGEGGPTTRAPEIRIEDIASSGVTTVIGCLGTDRTTRHMESLLAKARALEEDGITTLIFSGSYSIPVVTITGSVLSDLVLIEKVIGAGEIAISDHRSSQPTFEELARLAAECRVGGMLGKKAGVLHCHLGSGPRRLEMLFKLIAETEIPPTQVIPTHVNRNLDLLEEAVRFVQEGGFIDLTAGMDPESEEGEIGIARAVRLCVERKCRLTHITVSSDSNGSLPVFDEKGELVRLTIATQKSLIHNFRYLIQKNIVKPEEAIGLFSTNPASFYKIPHKGEIKVGNDADLLMLDAEYNITDSFSLGRRMMEGGVPIVKGTFS